jgi:hypothetical protein
MVAAGIGAGDGSVDNCASTGMTVVIVVAGRTVCIVDV